MGENSPRDLEAINRLRTSLHNVADLLRDADHLEPDDQVDLANLLDELREELDPPPSVDISHARQLADSVDQLVRAMKSKQSSTLLGAARSRVEDALARVESDAPNLVRIFQRFIDALASLGI